MSKSLDMHKKHKGKWETKSKVNVDSLEDLSTYYSPGVSEPCLKIKENKNLVNTYTNRGNMVAVISDGSAVLGLGNIGPEAAIPVMEGKCILFKKFANIDAVPIVINSQKPNEIIDFVEKISPSFGGINLEDISAPKCVKIERSLIKKLNIPVFHDDQHGTAIVACAALINSSRLTKKKLSDLNVFLVGVGAAGMSVARMVKKLGVKRIYACDKDGMISKKNKNNFAIKELLKEKIIDSFDQKDKNMKNGFNDSDIFIGLSAPNIVTKEMIGMMNKDPWVFAMANPNPEIDPKEAKKAGAKIVGTGRSDFPNQVNNLSAFPGIFKGVLNSGIKKIDEEIKMIAAYAIANTIEKSKIKEDNILPSNMNLNIPANIEKAIIKYAKKNK